MKFLLSRKVQISIFAIYLVASVFSAYVWLSQGYAVEKVISFYNFIGEVDTSGFLIFAGVASAIIYRSAALDHYRDINFFTGFWFAISQASIAAMNDLSLGSTITVLQSFLISTTVICGFGFVLFSSLAMAAYALDLKENTIVKSKLPDERINPDLASKSGSVQPSPAPSDLAHDLRYSRSRARRSRAQR